MTLPTETERADGRAPLVFLVFLALMTSVVALTIDAVLPALDAMDRDLGFARENDRQRIVLVVFLGLGLAQLVFGPLSDAIGRKPAALAGWAIFLVGSLVCLAASSPAMLILGRLLQGLGTGAPRIIAMAIVRDLYEGRPMARILSLVMMIFMIVPMLAPLLGQGIEAVAGWRAIFGLYLAMGAVAALWYLLGVPETLAAEARRPLRPGPLLGAVAEVVGNRIAMCYALAAVCIFSPFLTYLATAQQVFEEVYGLGSRFPLAFGALAGAFMAASYLNSRLVMRLGMRRLSLIALTGLVAVSVLALGLALAAPGGVPGFWTYMAVMAPIFFAIAVTFANFNALALQPLGHIAGTGAAVVMAVSTLGAGAVALPIAAAFDGSLVPIFAGFLGLGLVGLGLMWLAERGRG